MWGEETPTNRKLVKGWVGSCGAGGVSSPARYEITHNDGSDKTNKQSSERERRAESTLTKPPYTTIGLGD